MKNDNLTKYYEILSDCENYKISVNIDNEGKCYMPCFTLISFKEEDSDHWDNVKYLKNELIPWLNKETKDKELKKRIGEDRKIVKKLFKQAIKDGVFKEKLTL